MRLPLAFSADESVPFCWCARLRRRLSTKTNLQCAGNRTNNDGRLRFLRRLLAALVRVEGRAGAPMAAPDAPLDALVEKALDRAYLSQLSDVGRGVHAL